MNWHKAKIKDIAVQVRGVSYKPSDIRNVTDEGIIPILRANNITATELTLIDLVYLRSNCVSPIQILQKGDILIAASSWKIHAN